MYLCVFLFVSRSKKTPECVADGTALRKEEVSYAKIIVTGWLFSLLLKNFRWHLRFAGFLRLNITHCFVYSSYISLWNWTYEFVAHPDKYSSTGKYASDCSDRFSEGDQRRAQSDCLPCPYPTPPLFSHPLLSFSRPASVIIFYLSLV